MKNASAADDALVKPRNIQNRFPLRQIHVGIFWLSGKAVIVLLAPLMPKDAYPS